MSWSIVNLGAKHLRHNADELPYLQRANAFSIAVLILVPVFTPIFLYVGAGVWTWSLFGVLLNALLIVALNWGGHFTLARITQLFSNLLWLLFYCWLFGKESKAHLLFIAFATTPFILLPLSKWRIQLAFVLAFGISFWVIGHAPYTSTSILDPEQAFSLSISVEILTYSWMVLILFNFAISTERYRKKMRKYVQELELSNREMEQFVYIASHDLQEPLRAASSFAGLLKEEEKELKDDHRMYVNYVLKGLGRMQGLIHSLMRHSRIGVKREEGAVDLNEILEEVQEDLQLLISDTKAKIEIASLPVVFGVKEELRLLFQNLIQNAIKFQPDGQQAFISVEYYASEKGSKYWIGVRDNGIGIRPEHQRDIFLMFKRLNPEEKYFGSGIGLAHCMKIVKLHRGEIRVESELGKGSTFKVGLRPFKPKAELRTPISNQTQKRLHHEKSAVRFAGR